MRKVAALLLLAAPALFLRCTCDKGAGASEGGLASVDAAESMAPIVRPPEVEALWTEAADGGDDELARLADREGATGLVLAASEPRTRLTAIRAMAFSRGYVALPVLGNAAKTGDEVEAVAAVTSASAMAAEKRAQVDPEDAEEFREGCDALLAAAKDAARPRAVRVGAVRALRMWSDRGCAPPEAIPKDVDVK